MRVSNRSGTCLLIASLSASLLHAAPALARPRCQGKTATIVGTTGDDVLKGTRKDDVIVGRGGNDVIVGLKGSDRICAGAGDDLISAGPGRDRISGGPGSDFIHYGASKVPVDVDLSTGRTTGQGTDTFTGIEHVGGSEYADSITGDEGLNILFGEGGNDRIEGGDSIDIITGDEGDDTIIGGGGFDIMSYSFSPAPVVADLGTGSATGEGNDQLSEVEALEGSPFDDILRGDANNNFLFGNLGDDRLEGGDGHDSAVYWFAGAAVTADLSTGIATGDGTDTLVDLEGIFGTLGFDDTLIGDDGNNYLDGDAGNDVLSGGGGDDWLVGGPGDDQMDGGAGTFDVADFYATEPLTADLSTGIATGEGSDTLQGIEGLSGTDNADVLIGNDEVNYILGYAGDDQIRGGAGDDFLDAGNGSDSVDGGEGHDNCIVPEPAFVSCEGIDPVPVHPILQFSLDAASFRTQRAPRQ